jgi:hypothetical protein
MDAKPSGPAPRGNGGPQQAPLRHRQLGRKPLLSDFHMQPENTTNSGHVEAADLSPVFGSVYSCEVDLAPTISTDVCDPTLELTPSISLTTLAPTHGDDVILLYRHRSGEHTDDDRPLRRTLRRASPLHALPLPPEAPTPDPCLTPSSPCRQRARDIWLGYPPSRIGLHSPGLIRHATIRLGIRGFDWPSAYS